MTLRQHDKLLKVSKDAATALDWFAEALQGRGVLTNGSVVLGCNVRAWRMARDCARASREAIANIEGQVKE